MLEGHRDAGPLGKKGRGAGAPAVLDTALTGSIQLRCCWTVRVVCWILPFPLTPPALGSCPTALYTQAAVSAGYLSSLSRTSLSLVFQSLLSLASLSLVSLAFLSSMSLSSHPPSLCPHATGLGVSRAHVGGRRVKAQGTEGPCRTLRVGRRG